MKFHDQNGGIQLTNIDSFLNAIKCSWVKRYLYNTNTSKWKLFYQKILKKYGDSLLFECNIRNTILHEIANENIFLSDVLSAWSDVTHNLETKTSSKTILWNNKDITSNNKTFFYKDWFERSIKYVNQLYDYIIKDFYSFDDICYIYGIPSNNFLKYYTLIKSIPIHIKSEINTNNTSCTHSKTHNKWQVLFGEHELNWKHIFTMPYKATIESTLRNFQYIYIHRIIATNKYLFKCKLSNSNLCDFCSEKIETIEHLFWECKHIQPIGNQLVSFLEQQQLNVKLSFLNLAQTNQQTNQQTNRQGKNNMSLPFFWTDGQTDRQTDGLMDSSTAICHPTGVICSAKGIIRILVLTNNGGHVFQPTGTIFELIQDIIKTNLLTKFYYRYMENAPPSGGHVFHSTKTIFELVQDSIGTNLLTKVS
ncbi:hypothetical protein DPMN_151696 [Dreissena polymorpha]|uniref:Reverse transcriptase zinc-binding domain-containing protein n=1 Tax=Dreissena polymorpha TaxID=45954 RepID=A0A9D4FHM6_DREPO|nr:hypothetical protein DPMN_151696 [Dreissena polymorpha]